MSLFDYSVIVVAVSFVALTFYLAVKYLFWPGEKDRDHIKRTILEDRGDRDG